MLIAVDERALDTVTEPYDRVEDEACAGDPPDVDDEDDDDRAEDWTLEDDLDASWDDVGGWDDL